MHVGVGEGEGLVGGGGGVASGEVDPIVEVVVESTIEIRHVKVDKQGSVTVLGEEKGRVRWVIIKLR